MPLPSLPTELLQQIANEIESLETLRALSCVNSRFYTIFNPVLYQQDARINKASGSIAVTWAAQHGKIEILKKALNHGAEIPPCPRGKNKKSSGFVQRWKRISEEWSSHARDERTDHPLCTAVKYGHADITEFLIVHQKCKVAMWDRDGHLLLSVAVIHGHTHIIKLLLELGSPQFDMENYLVESPLQIAVVQGDEVAIKSLLYPPSFQCCWPNDIRDALEYALHSDEDNKERIIDLLLDAGYFPETSHLNFRMDFRDPEDYEAHCPLSWAIEQENIKYVKRFLSLGADPNHDRKWPSHSNLLEAVKRQRADMVRLLVPGTEQARRVRALAWSVKLWSSSLPSDNDKRSIPRILLENGTLPDYDWLDEEIITGTSKEAYGGESFPPEMVAVIIPPLIMAVDYRHFELVRLLVEYGANINVRYHGILDHGGRGWTMRTPLSLAAQLGHQGIVDFLQDRGAEVPTQSEVDWLKSIKIPIASPPDLNRL